MLTSRQIDILKVIINDFITNANPVGSKTLQKNYELPYSSATIRNEMATLEELGLLVKPHTSAGRVPSNQGYRYYVDYLLDNNEIDQELVNKLENLFNDHKLEIEDVVRETCNLIAAMTNYTSVAFGSDAKDEILKKIEIIPISNNSAVMMIVTQSEKVESKIFNIEDGISLEEISKCVKVLNILLAGTKLGDVVARIDTDIKAELALHVSNYESVLNAFVNAFIKFASDYVYVGGRNNIVNQPDFNDIEKLRSLVNIIDDHNFFDELAKKIDGTSVVIGNENDIFTIDDVAIISSNYIVSQEEKGVIAIIGPTRMDYDKVIHLLDYASDKISQLIKEKKR